MDLISGKPLWRIDKRDNVGVKDLRRLQDWDPDRDEQWMESLGDIFDKAFLA